LLDFVHGDTGVINPRGAIMANSIAAPDRFVS
jgi:hypothetical protein